MSKELNKYINLVSENTKVSGKIVGNALKNILNKLKK